MIVVFYVVIFIAGYERPIVFEYPVENWAACIYEVEEFAAKPSNELLVKGGQLRLGCMTEFEPSQEH